MKTVEIKSVLFQCAKSHDVSITIICNNKCTLFTLEAWKYNYGLLL